MSSEFVVAARESRDMSSEFGEMSSEFVVASRESRDMSSEFKTKILFLLP